MLFAKLHKSITYFRYAKVDSKILEAFRAVENKGLLRHSIYQCTLTCRLEENPLKDLSLYQRAEKERKRYPFFLIPQHSAFVLVTITTYPCPKKRKKEKQITSWQKSLQITCIRFYFIVPCRRHLVISSAKILICLYNIFIIILKRVWNSNNFIIYLIIDTYKNNFTNK